MRAPLIAQIARAPNFIGFRAVREPLSEVKTKLITYTSYKLPTYYYYSSFFPERHFSTSEEAINFEKSIALAGMHNKLRFYERNYKTDGKPATPEVWNFDHRDNYFHSTNGTPGFTEIPYTYSTKKCFIQIEEDKVVYRFFNEETQQYEAEIEPELSEETSQFYIYKNGYFDEIEDAYDYNKNDTKYTIEFYNAYANLPSPGIEGSNVYYYVLGEGFFQWDSASSTYNAVDDETANENLKSYFDCKTITFLDTLSEAKNATTDYVYIAEEVINPTKFSIDFSYTAGVSYWGIPCNYKGDLESGNFKNIGTLNQTSFVSRDYFLPMAFEEEDKVYSFKGNCYVSRNNQWYRITKNSLEGQKFKVVDSQPSTLEEGYVYYWGGQFYSSSTVDKAGFYKKIEEGKYQKCSDKETEKFEGQLFRYKLTKVETYLATSATQSDPWYVRICRKVYELATSFWNTIKKIGQAIGSFFSNLWSWLKGESYYGTEINFYWGNNIVETDTIGSQLNYNESYLLSNTIKDSEPTVKHIIDGTWEDIKALKYATMHRAKEAEAKGEVENNKYIYIIKDSTCYYKNGQGKWLTIPSVTSESMLPKIENIDSTIFYSKEDKICYRLDETTENVYKFVPALEYSDFTELYEKADAIRLVLNYDDDVYSTAFKNFNRMIQVLNEELGYNFPTNTNTVQPTSSSSGDWGFYFYDKYQGWITGQEASSLGII